MAAAVCFLTRFHHVDLPRLLCLQQCGSPCATRSVPALNWGCCKASSITWPKSWRKPAKPRQRKSRPSNWRAPREKCHHPDQVAARAAEPAKHPAPGDDRAVQCAGQQQRSLHGRYAGQRILPACQLHRFGPERRHLRLSAPPTCSESPTLAGCPCAGARLVCAPFAAPKAHVLHHGSHGFLHGVCPLRPSHQCRSLPVSICGVWQWWFMPGSRP